ncbi:MAG: hypothetical protein MUD01_28515 [Chloroflexaceae bacterium]|nr:hypothetical protein [Chloroflexaceae bacterium]
MSLSNIIIVLHRPQDATNIGAVLRAMHNMGLHQLRLVQPESFDAATILRVAHRCDDLLAATRVYADLDAALADAVFVVGTAAQRHGERPATGDMPSLASAMLTLPGPQPGPIGAVADVRTAQRNARFWIADFRCWIT